MTGNTERDYLDTDAFSEALRALQPADLLRLEKQSAYRAASTGMDGKDLLHEAILRTLEGIRNCPANVPIVVYLGNAMRSIANGERKKYDRETPTGDGYEEARPLMTGTGQVLTSENEALVQIELEEVVNYLQNIFADDQQALAALLGYMEGWTAAEIVEIEPMDDKQYAAARKRVRRAVERKFSGDRT